MTQTLSENFYLFLWKKNFLFEFSIKNSVHDENFIKIQESRKLLQTFEKVVFYLQTRSCLVNVKLRGFWLNLSTILTK